MDHIPGGSSQHHLIECYTKLPSSAQAVESSNDLLIEILFRVPLISIILFKSVSKRWLSILTYPIFTIRHRIQIPKLEPAAGLFIEQPGSSSVYNFVPFDIRIPITRRNLIFWSNDRQLIFLQSCHGLLLCKQINKYRSDGDCYYVYNPTINVSKKLPPCGSVHGTMKMAFDPTKSPHYKIVYVEPGNNDDVFGRRIRIHIYSSKTGN
ncbi:F-box protein At5g07610-like [Rutidosis leptorrhynchoides]|uniref:F-box protein At5g07610-like n=1 Tax=Rutidosis leptorrhynchoides TaxID=125765 RepID=UPI003A9A3F99